MSGALDITLTRDGARLAARIVPPPAVPVAGLMLGRAPAEVAALMPRIFNLCGQAQGLAARLAMGLEGGLEGGATDARREILRDHLAQLCLHWPQALGLAPRALPEDWAAGGAALEHWLWGGDRPADLAGWLASGRGVAPVLAAIAAAFGPGEAIADLPPLSDPMALIAQENSPAGRVADDPLMQAAAAAFGRGPLWRALGRGLDLARLCHNAPRPARLAPGLAVVEAARGSYALSVGVEAGRVTALTRVTPTDHLIAPGGVLERALASLPVAKADRAALLVAILDPCVPVQMREAEHA
ncbi:MAG: hypothetical protein IE922_09925 [Sphingomonadales bacterium]|nr:hypothetical protein [Sphingomonadales bacterium]